jgi:predicted ribosomally synthesized peptide with nif11-like leader
MSKQNAEKLKTKLEGDPKLADRVRNADATAFEALAASLGLPCTLAELRSALANPQASLSDDELEGVAGGLRIAGGRVAACGELNTQLTTCTKISTTTTPTGASRLFRG